MKAGVKIQRWFSKAELAVRFGVSPRSIDRWIRAKKFPSGIQTPNGHCLRWPDFVIEKAERGLMRNRLEPAGRSARR
jgi:hypothetical protein